MRVISFDVGIRNLALCMIDQVNSESPRIVHWEVTDTLLENNCTVSDCRKVPLEKLTRFLVRYLEKRLSRFKDLSPDCIAIEQQPSSRFCPNIKTKVLSHVIQSFFVSNFQDAVIRFVNPKAPKKLIKGADAIKKEKKMSVRYRLHKKLAIMETMRLLQDSAWLKFFETNKKKDDLADSYIQALFVLPSLRVCNKRKRHDVVYIRRKRATPVTASIETTKYITELPKTFDTVGGTVSTNSAKTSAKQIL